MNVIQGHHQMRLGLGLWLRVGIGLKFRLKLMVGMGTPFHANSWPPLSLLSILDSAYVFSYTIEIGSQTDSQTGLALNWFRDRFGLVWFRFENPKMV